MPSYAVLGATGNTGQALIQVLSQRADAQIHAYCRSKQKLLKSCPSIASNDQVKIFEGNLQNIDLLASCLNGTRAAFLAVASSENVPGCTVAQDTARVVLEALEKLKAQATPTKLPKLIVLSSASLEDKFMDATPSFLHPVLACAAAHVYHDLREAEKLLRAKESLVSTTFVRPAGLSHDAQKGHVIAFSSAKTPLSFLDLAAGMVEVADEASDQYDMKGVTVNPTADDVAFPWEAISGLFRGLLFHFLPWTYRYLG